METYNGHVRTPQDAIILFEACRLGVLPRVQRRLSEKERQQIRSGSVFVWDEREAGMRRWTDGKSWSASRVSGSFLTYREMEGKRGGNGFPASQPVKKNSSRQSNDGSRSGEGDLDSGEDGPDGYRYKPDGLMKQSFSITTNNGQHLHLISYYARSQPTAAPLKQPSNDPTLRHIRPAKGMYPEATVNEATTVPAVTRGPMPGSPYPTAPPQIAVAPTFGALVPPGYPPPGYPPVSWPGSPVAAPYAYYAHHPPPHPIHSPHPHAYPYPLAYAPPGERGPLSHLPPPTSSIANGHPPQSIAPMYQPPPGRSQVPPSAPPSAPPQAPPPAQGWHHNVYPPVSSDTRSHLPSPGPAPPTSAAQIGALPAPIPNGHKPLTPPPSTSTVHSTIDRPQSRDTSQPSNAAPPAKVLPTIGALINNDSSPQSSSLPGPAVNAEVNGHGASRSNSRSPASAHPSAPTGPQYRDLQGDKTSCRADILAIAALDGRFNKPTT